MLPHALYNDVASPAVNRRAIGEGNLDFGIQLATSAHSWKVAKRAEELGFTHAWFYDTQLLNAELFVAMGAAAMQTSRIRLGTGVLIPSNRIAPVTASALGSLNALAPGRIDFAVGTGFTGRRTMGLRAITLKRMESTSAWCRACWPARPSTGWRRAPPQDPLPQSGARADQAR